MLTFMVMPATPDPFEKMALAVFAFFQAYLEGSLNISANVASRFDLGEKMWLRKAQLERGWRGRFPPQPATTNHSHLQSRVGWKPEDEVKHSE